MKDIVLVSVLLLSLGTVSCRKQPAEVEISQTRVLTTHDRDPAVNATSSEQFLPPEFLAQIQGSGEKSGGAQGGPQSSSWSYQMPATDWKVAEKRTLRDINLTFGEGEQQGEVYLSVVGGGIQPNVDRWFRQFGSAPQSIEDLGTLDFLGGKAYFVEATGRYEPGMGKAGKDGQALLGTIAEKDGRLITIKLIGPEAEVASRREQFIKFVASLEQK